MEVLIVVSACVAAAFAFAFVPLLLAHLWVRVDTWLEGNGFTIPDDYRPSNMEQWVVGLLGPLFIVFYWTGILFEKLGESRPYQRFCELVYMKNRKT